MLSVEYETPWDFFEALDEEFHFTLDACASPDNAKCAHYFSEHDDGLKQPWTGETVWVNPPFHRVGEWIHKAYLESRDSGTTVVCLVQSRSSETRWWHEWVMRSSELRFVCNRLYFKINGAARRANFGSVVVVFRPRSVPPPRVMAINIRGRRLLTTP